MKINFVNNSVLMLHIFLIVLILKSEITTKNSNSKKFSYSKVNKITNNNTKNNNKNYFTQKTELFNNTNSTIKTKKNKIEKNKEKLKFNFTMIEIHNSTITIEKRNPLFPLNSNKKYLSNKKNFTNDIEKYIEEDPFAKAKNINCSATNCIAPNKCNKENNICLCSNYHAEFSYKYNIEKKFNLNMNPFVSNFRNLKKIDYEKYNNINKTKNLNDYFDNENNNNNNNRIYCGYKRKSKVVYILLEMIFNLGFGHFYIGNFEYGKMKFICISLPWIIIFILLINRKILIDNSHVKLNELPIVLYLIWVIWWFYDFVNIINNDFKDENNIQLR